MKLLWLIHGYLPILNAGAETYTHNLNKYLISQGHEVIVLLPKKHSTYVNKAMTYEGVRICINNNTKETGIYAEWADIVLSHLDYSKTTIDYINKYRPIVWVAHNTFYDNYKYINGNKNVSIIFNTLKAKELCPFDNKSIVLRPPITIEKTTTDPINNKYITLINLNELKGGNILKELASKMPTHSFMGVTGGYNEQIKQPDYVKVMPHTNKISDIYNETRVIIMPSSYESFGMVASEAMVNGIPVISTDCFGLVENLESAGIFCKRDKINDWIKAINLLDNEFIYRRKQDQCLKRADELKNINKIELKNTMDFLLERIEDFKMNKSI